MATDYIKQIESANVYEVSIKTPLSPLNISSKQLGNKLLLKREDLQPVFSFKCRGAYNKISNLTAAEKARGIIAASAGNHAQGVALAATHLAIEATIVMPTTAPQIKVDAVRARGAKVVLAGDNFDAAFAHALQLVEQHNYVYISPFDDDYTIAGQGTIGMEILEQHPEKLDAVFVPVGGGGLIAGIASYIKHKRPEIKIIGVEPQDANSMGQAIAAGKIVTIDNVNLFADGVAVSTVGKRCFAAVKDLVDEFISVSTDEICGAIKDIFNDTRSLAEPSGAVATAGMKKYLRSHDCQNKVCIAIHTGANINFDRLEHIAERADVGSHREALLAVTIPEQPGSCYKLCKLLENRNISEFNYRLSSGKAMIFLGVYLFDTEEDDAALIELLNKHNFTSLSMTKNEVARSHIRHMVGGRLPSATTDEHLFQITLPNRPDALLDFLAKMGSSYNISLFHYRDHGAAYGRVLLGLQSSSENKGELLQTLDKVGYVYQEVGDNSAYQAFLHNAQ
jgi:threonine dehydratase